MIAARLIPLFAGLASAQYAITDLIDDAPQAQQPRGWGAQPQAEGAPVPPAAAKTPAQTNVAVSAMSSLLGTIQGTMGNTAASPSTGSNGDRAISGKVLSQDSMAVVRGLVEAFMHKQQLEQGEKACLERNIATFAGDVMGTVGDIVTATKASIQSKGALSQQSSGPLVSAGIDSAMKLTSLVTLSTQVMKDCVHGDALALLKETAHHLTNGTYLEHRFLVSGIDIAHDLADAIIAFETHNFRRFGSDIGTSLRKILLSKSNKAVRLPEGVPQEVIIQKATDGLMKGFFVSGSALEITDTAHPDLDIRINLHSCIAGNSQLFKELWMSAWDLIAQLSLNGIQGLSLSPNGQQGGPKWSGELMTAMMQFPMAMSKCGITADMQTMFTEAINSLSDLKVQFHFPTDHFHTKEATEQMAKAVEAWTNWDFDQFGYELGKLFRELVMLSFPRKYSVDASGMLQRSAEVELASVGQKTDSIIIIIGGAAISLLVVLAAVRIRSMTLSLFAEQDAPLDDLEDGDTGLMME